MKNFERKERFDYPKHRLPILREMPKSAICLLMSEGNDTVYTLLELCMQVDPNIVLKCETYNLRGAQLFYLFIGYCEGFFPKFRAVIETKEPEAIQWVNQKVPQFTARYR
jgi:hypothetical protein